MRAANDRLVLFHFSFEWCRILYVYTRDVYTRDVYTLLTRITDNPSFRIDM